MNAAVRTVTAERLELSKAPAAELAAAAVKAAEDADLVGERPAYVVVAVPRGQIAEAEELVADAIRAG